MAFKTIHTNAGLIAMAEAEATGETINLTEMAVGDGNGNPVEPEAEQTQLARERYRAAVNRVWQDPENAQRFTAELVIPADQGGWTLREVGVFDGDGTLFAVGNLPESYKPTDGEGAFSDAVVRLEFIVANADIVTLQIDPNVAVATQKWISNNVTAGALIPGGTTGQQLVKKSNADGDTEWADPDVQNITVDIIDERQTLADQQTVVDLAETTTYGLAVYVEGLRLLLGSGSDEWQPDETQETRLTLGKSYAAGTEIYCVQNEPSGSAPAPLEKSKNLADVPDKAQGRKSLGVHSKKESNAAGQPADIKYTARSTAPTGWLKANGAAVSRSAYSSLFAAIGTDYGNGDGFDTFNLPDLRGEFIRGWDDGRGVDGGRALGSRQNDEVRQHRHSADSEEAGDHSHDGQADGGGSHNHGANAGRRGGHRHGYKDSYYIEAASEAQGADGYFKVSARSGSGDSDWDNNRIWYMNRVTAWEPNHDHPISIGNSGWHKHGLSIKRSGKHKHGVTVGNFGGVESRPRNVALLACIKF